MRFLAFFFMLIAAIAAAGSLSLWLGFTPDLPLAVLITAGAFLPAGELAALCLVAIWLLGSAPALSAEAVALFFIPLFWSLVHRFSSARPWIVNAAGSIIGVALFYLAIHSWGALREPFIARDILLAAAVSATLFAVARPLFSLHHEKHW